MAIKREKNHYPFVLKQKQAHKSKEVYFYLIIQMQASNLPMSSRFPNMILVI